MWNCILTSKLLLSGYIFTFHALIALSILNDYISCLHYPGNMLTFLVGSKQAFEVSLADVSQTQLQGKNEVVLEFHVDDTTGANEVCFFFFPPFLHISHMNYLQ